MFPPITCPVVSTATARFSIRESLRMRVKVCETETAASVDAIEQGAALTQPNARMTVEGACYVWHVRHRRS